MKKQTIKSKLSLNKNVISKLGAANIKGGGPGNVSGNGPIISPTVSIACTVTYTMFCDDHGED